MMVMNDDDLAEDLADWLEEAPEDRYESVKQKLEALTGQLFSENLRIEEDLFNDGLDVIKTGIMIIYSSLHEEH